MLTVNLVAAKAGTQSFDAEAHRGGRDARPENTLIAFAYAMTLGVTTLEMDMQMTKDGRIVISHDPYMNNYLAKGPDGRYAEPGKYDIRTMTLAEIKQFDLGTMNPAAGDYYESHGKTQLACPGMKMPTLEEVFELVKAYGNDQVMFNLETKTYPEPALPAAKNSPAPAVFVKTVYKIIKKYRLEDRVMLQSFDWRNLKAMKKLDPGIALAALTCEQPAWGRGSRCRQPGEPRASPWMAGLDIDTFKGDYVKAAKAVGADVVSPYWEELSNELVSEAHELGMKVVPWTVNQPIKMSMLLAMGVDGIITDKPWLLRELLINRGIAVAAPTVNAGNPYHTGTGIAAGAARIGL
ncbi:glycerophosphodiester phosphodiesterase [Sporomusa termitida]|uniref:GlycerophosphodieSPTER phosphodieSPTERase n=1 Tax=Sporomusa termitida TaxID=2377 RepID=A0A517DPY0_9FIRM|nr:glycerophosphodiester phosphodiesterase [Sporomusa termitida]QDR79425.1 GlycerophosphodieSPTER phosphodieSPTERase [Sporomusa termitida]